MTVARNPGVSVEAARSALNPDVSRRAALGGALALIISASLPSGVLAKEDEPLKFGRDAMPNGWRDDPRVFVAIDPEGIVTVTCHRSEMGQGVRTSIAMVVAEELGADWSKVRVAQAWGDETVFGNQDTDGSRSLRHFFMPLRRAGAAARTMLEQAAAAEWGVPASEVVAGDQMVRHEPSGRKENWGRFAERASKLPLPDPASLKLRAPADFRYIGKGEIGLIDNHDFTTGKANYGIDVCLDGLLYAVIARPPVFRGRVRKFDASAAMKVPGVLKVFEIEPSPPPTEFNPLGGVAVVARNTWAAIKGREALKIEWDDGPNASYDSAAFRTALEESARKPGKTVRADGDVDAAFAAAKQRVTAEYYVPHLAQAPMEPPVATARATDTSCEVWTCTQAPQATRANLAKRLGLKLDDVRVNVTLLGGGFGRKSKPDYVVEAALCSRAMDGAPVKLTWTREDDISHSYYHTVSVERIEAALDERGFPTAWLHRSVAPTIGSTYVEGAKNELPFELGMGLVNLPFAIPNIRIENPEAPAHVRIGWFRSVSNIPHAFAIQSFAAELAHAAGRDPKEYLLELIGPDRILDAAALGDVWNYGEDPAVYRLDTGRLKRTIEAAAAGVGWGRKLGVGRGLGIAGHYSFVTYTAVAAEVEVKDGEIAVRQVDIAVDCGPQVNPERIRSQMEGAVIMGMGLGLSAEITFKDGRSEQRNFDGYDLTRIDASPKILNVHLLPSGDYDGPLGGVGEPGVPPVAPAIANAVFAATGKRIRGLPLNKHFGA